MENASKAVLMAGAVLIAIGVISLALYFWNVMRGYISESENLYSATQIEAFNRFYESYSTAPGGITGADWQNIHNKAVDDEIAEGRIEINQDLYLNRYTLTIGYDRSGRVNSVSAAPAS